MPSFIDVALYIMLFASNLWLLHTSVDKSSHPTQAALLADPHWE